MTDTPTVAVHAAESGHWYSRDPVTHECHQIASVPGKNGTPRAPTIRDARVNDWAPGVTSIIRLMDKPGLTNWLVEQGMLAALTLPRLPGESEADWIVRVHADRKAHPRAAADEGTRIHAAIQASFQGEPVDPAYVAHVATARRLLPDPALDWRAEECVWHRDGFGTKADLHAWGHAADGRKALYVLDFKGKDGDQAAMDSQKLYEEHVMQLVATAEAILHTSRQAGYGGEPEVAVFPGIVFISRTHPGAGSLCWVPGGDAELIRAWEMFSALRMLWQAKNRHRPWQTLPKAEF